MNFIDFYIAFHDPIWVGLLSIVLFLPVRQLIWVLYVRKKQKTQNSFKDKRRCGLLPKKTSPDHLRGGNGWHYNN